MNAVDTSGPSTAAVSVEAYSTWVARGAPRCACAATGNFTALSLQCAMYAGHAWPAVQGANTQHPSHPAHLTHTPPGHLCPAPQEEPARALADALRGSKGVDYATAKLEAEEGEVGEGRPGGVRGCVCGGGGQGAAAGSQQQGAPRHAPPLLLLMSRLQRRGA